MNTHKISQADPGGDNRQQKKRLFWVSIFSWILIILSTLYFRLFPTLIDPVLSDVFIASLLFLLFISLVISSFMVQRPGELILVIPQYLLICFFARCIPYLRLPYPVLWDPYAFLVTFLNVHDFGTLEPIYSHWYPGVEGLINWPLMIIVTECLSQIGGIDYMWLFNYQQPLFGMLLFLGVYLLAYTVSRNYGVSLLAGLISSLSSHVIFYQSEYHYQGYAFIIFVLLLISLLKSYEQKSKSEYKVISIIFIAACTFSHYFSSLLSVFILGSFFFVVYFIAKFNKKHPNARLSIFNGNQPDGHFFLSLFLSVISYHLFAYPKHIVDYIQMISSADPYHAPVISLTGNVPFPTNIIHNIRFGILILGFASILYTIKTRKDEEIILAAICILLVALGVFGNVLIYLEVGRIVAFYEVLIGVFAALTLFRLRDIWLKPLNKQAAITALICIITAGIVTLTFFGGHYIPAYYFKSLGQNDYYWCENNLPDMQKYENGGQWVHTHVPENPLILTDGTPYFITSAIFFWGEVPADRIGGLDLYQSNLDKNVYIASNIKGNPGLDKKRLIEQTSRVYFNGEVEITSV